MIKCCACDQLITRETHGPFSPDRLHLVPINYSAEWKEPAMGNILAKECRQACALVCDKCFRNGQTIRYAIEYQEDIPDLPGKNAVYHKIEKLQSF
jgi:hypothetical protein